LKLLTEERKRKKNNNNKKWSKHNKFGGHNNL
jgi:hypothetical protein